ncbi:ovomucoid-like [Dreissena polymorpha]|uniref:Kazal-like domain-containing protein n=1 Tax=Dreissena polymorpha TaxID=45954 RepID=A0A9D4RM06_DREPO|nr:ovomucoid-like [Dreissena polymorpha]KAH3871262.1 hypothetical protein DPMN_034457 [Dreissena polymorpha]
MSIKIVAVLACLYVSSATSIRRQLTSGICDKICDDEVHEAGFCGTDGVFYRHHCEFEQAACKAHIDGDRLAVSNLGPCVDDATPCDKVLEAQCASPNHQGSSPFAGAPGAHIPTDFLKDAICASNHVTYPTICFFRYAQCMQSINSPTADPITLVSSGQCTRDLTNATLVNCTQYLQTSANPGLAVEVDPNVVPRFTCPRLYKPVCSQDDRTFPNECELCRFELLIHAITVDKPTLTALPGPCQMDNIFG